MGSFNSDTMPDPVQPEQGQKQGQENAPENQPNKEPAE